MDNKYLLIGGTSHVGKSMLGSFLAAQLQWEYVSTDKLARHPGRPWRVGKTKVPAHVAKHYLSLSVDELVSDVLRHYELNVWPIVAGLLASSCPEWKGISVMGTDAHCVRILFRRKMRGLRSNPTEESSQDANFRTGTSSASFNQRSGD